MAQIEDLVGRETELGALERFLDGMGAEATGFSIRGDAGIGKTALWKRCVAGAGARGYMVLVCRPAESETELPFAGLGDLLGDVGDALLEALPGPQGRAIEIALLRAAPDGPAPHPRALGLGVLGALRELSVASPVLVAIDDLQWLDRASARVLVFAARRLSRERVGILASRRSGTAELELAVGSSTALGRSSTLELPALPDSAIDELLRRGSGRTRLSRSARARIARVAGGNPYFALELAAQLGRAQPAPQGTGQLPVPESLRDLVRRRVADLPARARSVSIAVAALAHPTVGLVTRACGVQGSSKLARAAESGVIELDGDRVRLAHPLIGSILYGDASPRARRTLHRRLAAIVDDPEERARHLALSTPGPDAAVASMLDEAASRARSRGAPDAAGELFERARVLTPATEADAARIRGLAAAECSFEAGDTDRARTLLERAVGEWPSGPGRATPLTALAWVCAHREGSVRAAGLFAAALAESPVDPRTRIAIERGLGWTEHMLGNLDTARRHARRALVLARAIDDPLALAEALADVGFLETLRGRGVPWATMEEAMALERAGGTWRQIFGRAAWLYALVLEYANRYDAARGRLDTLRRDTLERGDEHSLPFVLSHLCRVELYSGDWDAAAHHADECYAAAMQTGQEPERAFALSNRALVASHAGRVDEAQRLIEVGLGLAEATGVLPVRYELVATRGFLELSLGRASDASRLLLELDGTLEAAGFAEPGVFRHEANTIEALVGAGEVERAARLTARLERRGRRLKRPLALAGAARCRALLAAASSNPAAAHEALERALEHHAELGEPFELARTLLVRGVVERRDRQKRAARASLEQALAVFEGLGAPLWAARAEAELQRAGGRAGPARSLPLTATESKIAELVAEGLPNKDVASALFLSPKTVEWNLSKIYRKLGIRARTELADRLAAGAGTGAGR